MDRILVTREQYDVLVKTASDYMVGEWMKLRRQWCLAGVACRGTRKQLEKLAKLLEPIPAC